jgi:TolB-like protein
MQSGALQKARRRLPPRRTNKGRRHFSIVVLPFANMTGDPEQDYFVDGVTESLTTDLSRSGCLVIGRNTAFTYKGKHVDLRRIGRELNVRYVLEGSVQRSGGRMRIGVQLIDAESCSHLWAERFDKPSADLLDMQDEIVARICQRAVFAARPRRGATRGAIAKSRCDGSMLAGQGFVL